MRIEPATFGEHFNGRLKSAMQEQFCPPGEEMGFGWLHFCGTLEPLAGFEGTSLPLLDLRQLGMQVRVVFTGKHGSNGGFTRSSCVLRIAWGSVRLAGSFSDQRSCILQ